MIKKIERKTLSEQVYKQMEQQIQSGKWKVGERIPNEKFLMEQFGISRNTLREAISSLSNIGLVETHPGDGTFVIEKSELSAVLKRYISQSSLLEILEIRHALDREAATLSPIRRTEKDLEVIHNCLKLCQEALAKSDIEAFVQADLKFHQSVIDSAHNKLLSAIYMNLSQKIQMAIISTIEIGKKYANGHTKLAYAIEKQNVERATQEVDRSIHIFKMMILKKEKKDE